MVENPKRRNNAAITKPEQAEEMRLNE